MSPKGHPSEGVDKWGIVVYSGAKWETRSAWNDVLRRVRAHHRRQEPAHAAGPLPRRARGRCRAHAGTRRVPRCLSASGLGCPRRVAAGRARSVLAGGARVEAVLLLRRCDAELDKQGASSYRRPAQARGDSAREVVVAGVHDHLEIWDRAAWSRSAHGGRRERRRCCRTSCREATDHVPVLAEEVRELLAVQPGETVVDGTFGAGRPLDAARRRSRRRAAS